MSRKINASVRNEQLVYCVKVVYKKVCLFGIFRRNAYFCVEMMKHKFLLLTTILASCLSVWGQGKPTDLTTVPDLQLLGTQLLKGKQGSIVAIKPSTGEVLCLVSSTTSASMINRGITGIYPPGSTFKVAQALVMYTEGVVDKSSLFACDMGFYKDEVRVGCHRHASPLKLVEALAYSCNSWFCQSFMSMIGNTDKYRSYWRAMNMWHDYMQSMGFGHTLGIDMKNEAAGLMPDGAWMMKKYGENWTERNVMYLAMGQGQLTVTPLQLCNLAATIANRGYYYTPYIHPSTARKYPVKYSTKQYTKASREAYDQVVAGMRAAVVKGTASAMNVREYSICGKTGTVENAGADHSAFIGFAPMYNPQIAIAVYVENGGFGADVAAPIAGAIIKAYLKK